MSKKMQSGSYPKKTWKLVAVQKLKYETRCFPKKTEKIDVFQKLKTRYFPKNLINWRLPKTENLMFSKKMKTGCSPKKRKLDVFQKILKTGWCPIKMQSGCCPKINPGIGNFKLDIVPKNKNLILLKKTVNWMLSKQDQMA